MVKLTSHDVQTAIDLARQMTVNLAVETERQEWAAVTGRHRKQSRFCAFVLIIAAILLTILPVFVHAWEFTPTVRSVAQWKFTPAAPAPSAPATRTVNVVQHAHRCRYDGTTWWHGAENHGNVAAHTCPQCGRQQYQQTGETRTVKIEVPITAPAANPVGLPVLRSYGSSNCPGGVCPLPRGLRQK